MRRRVFLGRLLWTATGSALAAAGGIWMLARAQRARFFRALGGPRRYAKSAPSRHDGARKIRPVTREELYGEHDLVG